MSVVGSTTRPRASRGGLAADGARKSARRRGTRVRAGSRADVVGVSVAAFGLLLCVGVISFVLSPLEFRIVKHAFYLGVAVLLLMDAPAAFRVARRDPWLWALVGLMCASALWSESPGWALKRGLVTFQTTTFGLYLAVRLSLDDQLRIVSWVLAVTLFANLVYLLAVPEHSYMIYAGKPAFMGFLGHKNAVGLVAALALPALMLRSADRGRWLVVPAMGAAALLLVLSRSISGASIGAMLCGVVALAPLAKRLRRPVLLLLPPAALAIGWIAAMSGLADGILTSLGRDPTLTGRTAIWSEALPTIREHWLLGHSIVSFWQERIVERTYIWFSNAHNGFLQQAIELGVVGVALLLLQMTTTLFRGVRAQLFRPSRGVVWALCVGSLFLVYNLSEVVLMEENSIVWVLVVAASLGVRRVEATSRGALVRRAPAARPSHV